MTQLENIQQPREYPTTMTANDMKTCNAFFKLMRESKVKAELDIEPQPSYLEGEPHLDVAVVFTFNGPEAPDGYNFKMRFDQAGFNAIHDVLHSWRKGVTPTAAGQHLRIEGTDNHAVATSDDLHDIWEFLDELCREEPGRRLTPLDEMSQSQKETLLTMAVNDSKWVSEGKMDINVQETMIENGELKDCMAPAM